MDKTTHEEFTKFFESPNRASFKDFIESHFGEFEWVDFKEKWPLQQPNDKIAYSKMARHVLALSNSGGGCIIFGLKEQSDGVEPIGLETLLDKSKISRGLQKFIPSDLKLTILDFSYNDPVYDKLKGKSFQVLIIEDVPKFIPFISSSDGVDIRKNAIYVRNGTESEEVSYGALQEVINRRIETEYSSTHVLELEEHLEQLNLLCQHKEKDSYGPNPFGALSIGLMEALGPRPTFSANDEIMTFLSELIEKKKEEIRTFLL